jgi:diguanylate cyclase (GGDEF)-like protein
LKRLLNFIAVPSGQPELVQAQLRAFSRQVPLLYFVLVANMHFVAATHYGSAPNWLTMLLPALFSALAAFRIVGWWRARKHVLSAEKARKRLKSTVILAGAFGAYLAFWSFALLEYGDAYQNGHVAFFMGVTLVACVFCLMHLRAAAFVLTVTVAVPFVIEFGLMQNTVMLAVALNMGLVASAMLYILSTHYDEFTTMVNQQISLARTNTEALRLSAENHKLANLDSLTELPNRRNFISVIEAQAKARADSRKPFAVGLIDLDGFKAVNDLYGHAVGDGLLVAVSRRLTSMAKPGVVFARLGGDEFGFVTQDTVDIGALGMNICETLRQPYLVGDTRMDVSASCGIAVFPSSCETLRELLECADYALYQAKLHNNGGVVTFTSSHREQLRMSQQVDHALRHADLEAEMSLAYQPVVNSFTGETVSIEALARWNNALLGQVSPARFIAVAERSPMINKITRILLTKLFNDMNAFPKDIAVSFNLSSRSLASPDVMLQVIAAVQASHIDTKRIQFEVTETALLVDFDAALRALHLLRNLGCKIALDDFGTGYSSLSYVHKLPLDTIKIDRRFVMDIDQNAKARDIVKTIVGLSSALKLDCVAEGVETADQVAILQQNGCCLMQGFHYCMPLPASEIVQAISGNKKSATLATT